MIFPLVSKLHNIIAQNYTLVLYPTWTQYIKKWYRNSQSKLKFTDTHQINNMYRTSKFEPNVYFMSSIKHVSVFRNTLILEIK